MIRGGHVDASFLGTLQVDGEGNIAGYAVPGERIAVWVGPWTYSPERERLMC